MGTQLATLDPIPKLPPRLASLVDRTGDWSDDMGCLRGWRPPERLDPSWAPAVRANIAMLEAALAPMTRFEPVKLALVRLGMVTAKPAGDALRHELWLEAVLDHLRGYPEGLVLDRLHHAERICKFRPTPSELVKLLEDEMAGPRDELTRLRRLLAIAERPALPAPPEETAEERAKATWSAMAKHRDWMRAEGLDPDAKPTAPPCKPCRRYAVPRTDWPRDVTLAWIQGWRARRSGLALPGDDWGQEGYLACGGHIVGELAIPDWLVAAIDAPPPPAAGDGADLHTAA